MNAQVKATHQPTQVWLKSTLLNRGAKIEELGISVVELPVGEAPPQPSPLKKFLYQLRYNASYSYAYFTLHQ